MLYSWHLIGERIRDNRKEKGLTQDQIAEYVEQITNTPTTRQLIAGWENGKPVKKIEQLTALCEIFDCDMAYLLREYDTKHVRSQDICTTLGITEKAVDTLISSRKIGSMLSGTISELLENKEFLYQLHDCCTAVYGNTDYETRYEDIFSHKKCRVVLRPEKMQQVNLMLLYNSLCGLVDRIRTIYMNQNEQN